MLVLPFEGGFSNEVTTDEAGNSGRQAEWPSQFTRL
jgi:hypothetical protein